jgi:hypothetical protein
LDDALGEALALAVESWSPGATYVVSALTGGRSAAAVLRIDLRPIKGDELAGVFIAKVELTGNLERSLVVHESVEGLVGDLWARHIPPLVRSWRGVVSTGQQAVALMYGLAGGSLLRYVTGARRGSVPLQRDIEAIAHDTLHAWARPANVVDLEPKAVLDAILSEEKAARALALATDFFGSNGVVHEHGHVFLSPVTIFNAHAAVIPLMRAFQHGDFHAGNIVLPEVSQDDDRYFLIDFEKCGISYLGLDNAYLELSLLCDFYADISPATLARCCDAVSTPPHISGAIPDDTQWLTSTMLAVRTAELSYMRGSQGREDDLRRQFLLARIVESLRWAVRHQGRRKSRLALLYGGWHTLRLMRLYPEYDLALGENEPLDRLSVQLSAGETVTLSDAEEEVWNSLWRSTAHFGKTDYTYILATDQLSAPDLSTLGNIPWSAVIDLDPKSDTEGLYSMAGPALSLRRSVHVYHDRLPAMNPQRGCAWLMSGGWRLRHVPYADFPDWVRGRLRMIRELFSYLHRSIGDQQVILVVLVGRASVDDLQANADRLARILEAFDEEWQGQGRAITVGSTRVNTYVEDEHFPLETHRFLSALATVFGEVDSAPTYHLPSPDGPVALPVDTIRSVEEHLVLLHDQIGVSGDLPQPPNDEFWRGGQITWNGLSDEVDVPRAVTEQLTASLMESLRGHRTQTVVMSHEPGAGGTTAALRAAWDLHWTFPVAVLAPGRTVSLESIQLIADRLQRLYVSLDNPILFVAESGDLPEQYREQLYRELSARNARVTLLYVRRSLSPNRGHLHIPSLLSEQEGKTFSARYRQLTSDPARTAELSLLTTPSYSRYCTPFFFGLIAYQREFTKLTDYVGYHLEQVAGRLRDLLCHLSLVTLYSTSGLQASFIQQYLLRNLKAQGTAVALEDLFGPAAPLVVQRVGRIRIAHQLVAEEILAALAGPQWRGQLSFITVDLIDDLCAGSEYDSEPTRLLLRQMFTDRVSGSPDGAEDRGDFSPLIADLDDLDVSVGHEVLKHLANMVPEEPHFWNHLGRHQIFRLNRDPDLAEQYLERAVALAPNDAIHHHTLGLARRARLRQGLRSSQGQGVEPLMAVIDAWFYRTVECFEHARNLSPDDIYNYITHVQTILQVARAVRTAERVSSIAEVKSMAGEWLVHQLTVANSLLDDAVALYAALDHRDDYLQACLAEIEQLYGNLDGVVRLWEIGLAGGSGSPYARLALAQAYFVRARRSWRGLSDAELSRIRSLTMENLRRGSARDEDFRFWFESAKLLGDFDVESGLAQLEMWSDRSNGWRAEYYKYVLLFILWLQERTEDVDAMSMAQDECAKRSIGRKNHSYVWLARNPSWCPLIADSDLGEWDKHKRFWGDTGLLQRVNGVIDVVHGPAAGVIALPGGKVKVFFVPVAGGFLENADEGAAVNFFLGFSVTGARAWDVRRGHVESAVSRVVELAATPSFVGRPLKSGFEEIQARRAAELTSDNLRQCCRTLVEAAAARGGPITIGWLAERVRATFGFDELTYAEIRSAVSKVGGVTVRGSGAEAIVDAGALRRPPADEGNREVGAVMYVNAEERRGTIWRASMSAVTFKFSDVTNQELLPSLRRNTPVRYTIGSERRSDEAIKVEILPPRSTLYKGEEVAAHDLSLLVAAELRDLLEEALAGGRRWVAASEVEDHLERVFVGDVPLGPRLEVSGLRVFLRSLDWIKVTGPGGDQRVSLVRQAPFGTARSPELTPSAALRQVVDELSVGGKPATLQGVGPRLKRLLGESGYADFVGSRGLKRAIASIGGWVLTEVKPGLDVVMAASDGSTEMTSHVASPSEVLTPSAALRQVVDELSVGGKPATLQGVGPRLKRLLGESGYADFVGTDGLRAAVDWLDQWTVTRASTGVYVVSPVQQRGAGLKT